MLSQKMSGIIDATGKEIAIFNLFDFMKKDSKRKEIANTGISAKNNKNMNGSYDIPTMVGIMTANPNIKSLFFISESNPDN